MRMKLNKGITYILGEVVIIAVTLSIAAGFIGWILSVYWNVKQPEIIKVFPDSHIFKKGDGWVLQLHLANRGGSTGKVYKIVIVDKETLNENIVIPPNAEERVNISLKSSYVQGVLYSVKLYTESGDVYNEVSEYIPAT